MSSSAEYVFTRSYLDNNRTTWSSNSLDIISTRRFRSRMWKTYGLPTLGLVRGMPISSCSMAATHMYRVWLTDLVDIFPATVQLDGLDISFNATPPRDWLPTNMRLHHWDITAEVPEHLLGVYDVVHVPHFAFVLRQPD
ncbi:hypothetical protein GB937_010519 [Aspergillus fischeri]|nr:hypothetical protein GB937_010519 [Aspergillus fischeri]